MSDALQTVPDDSQSAAATLASDSQAAPGAATPAATNGEATGPKFKRIKPEELAHLAKFIEYLPDGNVDNPIQFTLLPRELKLLILPTSNARLVERDLLELTYDEDTGAIETVSINPLAYAGYKRLMEDESATPTPASIIGGGIRGSRGEYSNHKFKLVKTTADNPHREGTRRYYTWLMYDNGDSMDQVRVKPYDRNIKLYTGKYFNGPDRMVIELDINQGYLWVYDSTENEKLEDGTENPKYWVSRKPRAADSNQEETLDDQEVTTEA